MIDVDDALSMHEDIPDLFPRRTGEEFEEYENGIEDYVDCYVTDAGVVEWAIGGAGGDENVDPVEENADFENCHADAVEDAGFIDVLEH